MWSWLAPPAALERSFPSPQAMRREYRYWRLRELYATFIGYAVFYFVRKNIPVAMPFMEKSLGYSKADMGLILTLSDLVYGVSKFLNGLLADRSNPRIFMAVGLTLSAAMNWGFGTASGLATLGAFWVLNGWFQGMGFPPVARVLSHWFSPRERGTYWGLWNTSHQVGAAVILVLASWAGAHYGWRACFTAPAVIALLTAAFLYERLRDTPGSLGLPPVEQFTGEEPPHAPPREQLDHGAWIRFLRAHVFCNRYIWMACLANFFVYVIRYGFMNWAPSYLQQVKGMSPVGSGAAVASFEIAGLVGSLFAGWLTDRFFQGRRGPVCVYYMVATTAAIALFWKVPPGHPWLDTLLLQSVGFLVYGPQFLVGVMVADLATRRAAATAIGLTGFFGYLSGILSGLGMGSIVDRHGWDAGFALLVACGVAATIPFLFTWNARPAQVTEDG